MRFARFGLPVRRFPASHFMNSMYRILFAIMVLGGPLRSVAQQSNHGVPSEEEMVKRIGGVDVLKTLHESTRVEAVTLQEKKLPGGSRKYVEVGRRFDLSPKQAAE